ncbi:LysR substrate-binding domain-containing protein [Saccharopolyspora sp. MS10]|uniref:LysR substrate-binding domain-containing protein n=1 Tax=Saccharopolyspora sp. MS10 TaxID=3385973 RepID=UPI00399FA6AF
MAGSVDSPSFSLGYVPGVTPGKWARIWAERRPSVPLDLVSTTAAAAAGLAREGAVDAVLLRLPTDRDGLHAIPLYTETTVVVVPKDHVVTAAEEVSPADLADELVLHPLDDALGWTAPPGRPAIERPATTGAAIELVAAGVGLLVVPQSLARLHHRKDLTYRPVADVPQSRVALAWPEDGTGDLVEEFIGVVRGRTANSTRGQQERASARGERPAKTVRAKPAANRAPRPGGRSGKGKPRRR